MHYEICVSLEGKHYFATADRSITDSEKARRVYEGFTKRFPKGEGFEIRVTLWETTGTGIDFNEGVRLPAEPDIKKTTP